MWLHNDSSASSRRRVEWLLTFAALGALGLGAHPVQAAGADLRWIPSTSPGVVGYRVHVGSEAGFYTAGQVDATIDVGGSYTMEAGIASHPLADLISGPSWIVMTAYDDLGNESPASNQRFRDLPQPCSTAGDCADGDACNGQERCEGGICQGGQPLACQFTGSCQVGRCDPAYGCVADPAPDGTVCDDGEATTDDDRCEAGACFGVETVLDPIPPFDPGDAPIYLSFDDLDLGTDPSAWLDTGASNSLVEADSFEVLGLADGSRVFGTQLSATNVHSHLLAPGSDAWSGYELRGRMRVSESNGGIGVTLYSDYPRSDAYYRLRRYGSGSFHFSPHPDGTGACVGTSDTGVRPSADVWYTFRFRAFEDGGGTRVQAKVWRAVAEEPLSWQADCVDASATRRTRGSPGIWSMGAGEKYWDDLAVLSVEGGGGTPIDPLPTCQSDFDCSDGDVCTGLERCVEGLCLDGVDLQCSDPALCLSARCDAAVGCVVEPLANGAACGAGDACTNADTCQGGVCTAGAPISCPDPGECRVGHCDGVRGCESTPVADGTACDDGDASTGPDVCGAGVCGGSPPPPPDPDPIPEPDPAPIGESGRLLFDFEDDPPGGDPAGWLDTGSGNTLREANHYGVFEFADGNRVFGTRQMQTNTHSHYVADESHRWFDYELRGRMWFEHPKTGVGVTIYSDYPASDSYYRLRRHGNKPFHLANHPHDEVACEGSTTTSVRPGPGVWYAFRLQAFDDQSETRLRAKVWVEGEDEPEGWEIDCLVPADRAYFSGSPGVWSMGRGGKYWDDLEVIELNDEDLP